ncbi:alpha/beta hydrolase [Virgibacillus halophilus]|uniref:Alpha/beta fold hydrolase n=1 Tax=Tigheibacillus halophilus TaxID=361280 RepID=A0ABU5CB76_9BACI|nr:alpha/beta fold hydrolase [Virgibacillus halophilus]
MSDFQVMEEAEAFYFKGNHIGVLVIHGFTGSTQSMRYLGEQFANQGFTVYGPRLKGHGTAPEDMEKATHQDWIDSVENGLQKLKNTCDLIFITGLSMGGTLTLYLAENHPDIRGIMPINAAVEMPELKLQYEQLKDTNTRFIAGIGSDIKQRGIKELAYEKTPVRSMGEIIKLTEMVKKDLGKITAPAMVFSSVEDHVVPPENSRDIFDSIQSKNRALIMLDNSYHVATLDHDKALIAEKCISFIDALKK